MIIKKIPQSPWSQSTKEPEEEAIRVKEDGTGVVTDNVKMSTNPPDDNAIEEAVKIKESGKEKKQNPRLQVGNVDEYIDIMNNLNLKKPAEIETNVSRNINLGA